MTDYRPMWEELGLDLEKHDGLLKALPSLFHDIYLTQKGRPRGMDYFDFVISEIHGLRVQELVEHAKDGGKVVAVYCVFVPEELILAAEGICVGLCAGTEFSIPAAEGVLPTNTCALIKSSFGFKLGRICPYVQSSHLIVGETTCDGKKKMFEFLAQSHPTYVIEVPHKKTPQARRLFLEEIREFKSQLEAVTGNKITPDRLSRATGVVNNKRRALQRLYDLRKARSSPISGRDALLVTQIAFYDDSARFTGKVNHLCDELEERVKQGQGIASAQAPRLLISGSPMAIPNWKLHHLIESSGGVVVCEESCTGTRYFSELTPEADGTLEKQIEALSHRYLGIHCACFTPNEERVDDILRLVKEYQVDGVIHYNLLFCHTYANEAIKVEKALAQAGIPLLRIETDYSEGDYGQLKTRIEAFLEMISR